MALRSTRGKFIEPARETKREEGQFDWGCKGRVTEDGRNHQEKVCKGSERRKGTAFRITADQNHWYRRAGKKTGKVKKTKTDRA